MPDCRTLFFSLTASLVGATAVAQSSSTRDTLVAAGSHYRASGLHELMLGREYRSLWTTAISVPVLDLSNFAGGLRPVSKGGGFQTKSLLLAGADGREFFFRSIDKDPSATLPLELRSTVAGSVVRDQTSSALPTGPLVVARLLQAAGIPHGPARLYVLPRKGLGQFDEVFGGLLGFLEDRIGGPSGPGAKWGGAAEIIGSDSLFARTGRSPDDRVDARALLKARLFDLLIGDWDRHSDQWVWARFADSVPRIWIPIPRDRDQAFVKYDGLLLSVARTSTPTLINFGPKYPYLPGATWNGRDIDRRFLVELEWPEWQAAVTALQTSLTDSVIADAVRALPAQHRALKGETLSKALRQRRDGLPKAAEKYYRLLAEQVDVHATAQSDRAQFTRVGKDTAELTLSQSDKSSSSPPYYRRRFDSRTTKEVRVYLGAGDDRLMVRGPATEGPLLRGLGEDGRDLLVDSSRSNREKFYDDSAGPARTQGYPSKIDRRSDIAPPRDTKELPPRDWGQRWIPSTWASYGPDIGLFIGGGRTLTIYGFRKYPYSSRHRFLAGIATGPWTYRLDYQGDFRREDSRTYFDLRARASGVEVISFHGFGNEIPAPGDNEFYRVTQDAYGVLPSIALPLGPHSEVQFGPLLKYVSTDNHPDRFLATLGDLYGTGNFGELGGRLTLRHDTRDREQAAQRGLYVELTGTLYPALWDVDSVFGEVHGEARTFLTAHAPLDPTLALRVGGKKVWGQYPFFEAAFLGGASTVRLGTVNRYAGDASAYGSAELRLALARFELILPTQLGVFGLADVGRVYLAGESSDTWHSAFGGGLSLSYLQRAYTFSVALAAGDERTAVYVQAGFGF